MVMFKYLRLRDFLSQAFRKRNDNRSSARAECSLCDFLY